MDGCEPCLSSLLVVNLVAVDPPAKSLTVGRFSGNPLDFPKN